MVNETNPDEEKLKEEVEKGKNWTKEIKKSENFKTTTCPEYDPIKDFHQDDASFILIKVNNKEGIINVGICNYNYQLLEEFIGKSAQQIYTHILNNTKYISRLDHAAYLGKELKRAEIALKNNEEYTQE